MTPVDVFLAGLIIAVFLSALVYFVGRLVEEYHNRN